ncbi:DUF2279 domain-containing protein [Neolewinella lacunae]|uniref:DUF2279 domain-containing protein n=1 Tax=Neolewinella lacunae TaxID=1517758 RepID=A0A923PMP7_9BACT|nr:DUF2279 domain-containing protein [Neolewinella lacunae]MBC6995541.1 DUF2279 domain-containing protein [Neolewinella lacunae]MDN3635577.1 DUF2279 domain-containing protein [Neolewinella lacunae]
MGALALFPAPLEGQLDSLPDYTQRDPLQGVAPDGWLRPADSFNKNRFYLSAGTGAALYGAASVGLYQTWYAGYDRVGLHSFDDWGEWNQMDKAGHVFTAYMFSRYAFAGVRWAGVERPGARLMAFGVANLLQGTIEVLDGFSSEWGFSWSDIGANVTGSLIFTAQDLAWREQRILIKVSNDLRAHPDVPITNASGAMSNLGNISRERFGDNFFERYLKDYNAQTIWLSANPRAFFPQSKAPTWLNLAVGYGSENVYGAYGNVWSEGGQGFFYPESRYRQWFLSPDVYFSRIPTRKRGVRLLLGILDFVKLPAPALEYSRGKFRGHWVMW